MVLPDRTVAQSFALPGYETPSAGTGPKGLQSPKGSVPECRFPFQKDHGKKRTCCGSEAAQTFRREGPGMWNGVL